ECGSFLFFQLADAIFDSIAANKLELEPVHEDKPHIMPCALTNVSRFCPYRVRVSEDAPWHRISLLARNRVSYSSSCFSNLIFLILKILNCGPARAREAFANIFLWK
ncbi:hypothetical protein GCK32_021535, partial [Trichostrongylus colubriformis]